jgi:hypothetical protein
VLDVRVAAGNGVHRTGEASRTALHAFGSSALGPVDEDTDKCHDVETAENASDPRLIDRRAVCRCRQDGQRDDAGEKSLARPSLLAL